MGSKVIPVAGITGYSDAFRAKMLINQPVSRVRNLVIEEIPTDLAVGEKVPLCRNSIKSREGNREIAREGSPWTGVACAGLKPTGSQAEMGVPTAVVEVQLRDVAAELKSGKVLLGRRIANDRPRDRFAARLARPLTLLVPVFSNSAVPTIPRVQMPPPG